MCVKQLAKIFRGIWSIFCLKWTLKFGAYELQVRGQLHPTIWETEWNTTYDSWKRKTRFKFQIYEKTLYRMSVLIKPESLFIDLWL